jgi:hypothetical protein
MDNKDRMKERKESMKKMPLEAWIYVNCVSP